MSVVGFDLGSANCFIAVARAGGIETVANEYSDRCTPAIVAFNNLHRLVGISAKNQMVMNHKATVTQFKSLLGRKFDEPFVQEEIKRLPYKITRTDGGDIGIQVQYRGESKVYSPEQIMAMLLTELKNTAQDNLHTKVTDCVISVPSFYTDYQRRALLRSAQIAGINCLKLMNDTSAVALNYGLFKQDLPTPEEKPRHVAFVDMGYTSFQVAVAAFNKGKIKLLATASDPNLGGRNFDDRLKEYFAVEFLNKYKIDAKSSPKAWLRLGTEIEKIKKQMSSNSTNLPLNIECFMDDKDVTHKINREQFEEMSQDLIDRIQGPLQKAIQESGLKIEEIDVVEIVGGSSRIPALKAILDKVFQKPYSTTLNQDEAVARGCAIQCAMLSHTVKVRDIEVMDAATYPIHIAWDSVKSEEGPGEMEVFKRHHSYPFTKMLTFPHRVEPFRFRAFYHSDVEIPHFEREIGEFIVNAAAPSESNDTTKVKVKVKVRLDIHGCFTVSSATMVETLPPPPEPVEKQEPMETSDENLVNGEKAEEATKQETDTEETPETGEQEKVEEKTSKVEEKTDTKPEQKKKEEKKEEVTKPVAKKPKKLTKSTELNVAKNQFVLSSTEMNLLVDIENELIFHVRLQKEISDAKNAVEEYVYFIRDKMYDLYSKYISESDREQFSALLTQTEDWLYDEGENQSKQVYIDKLTDLKKFGQPMIDRFNAYENLPAAFEAFGASVTHYRKILTQYAQKEEKYAHIEEAEMKKAADKLEEKFKWFNDKMQANAKSSPVTTPVVYPSQVYSEKKLLEDFCNPIVNKPKPKVEPPKDDGKKKENGDSQKENAEPAKETPPESMETDQKDTPAEPTTEQAPKSNLDMEVD